ncbi:hypothetical protein V1514DRAFT_336785 [Lipomyces japonicus]|uniref:uncharacterized protein n=1 Tax=Lipomyces japonicus TaxID=56871 RepID=UPI0034CEC082
MIRLRRSLIVGLSFVTVLLFLTFASSPVDEFKAPDYSKSSLENRFFSFGAFTHLIRSVGSVPHHAESIVFITSDTKAASKLVQLANDLAINLNINKLDGVKKYLVPSVNFLFLGSYSLDLDFFTAANGVNTSILYVHDGRAHLNQRTQYIQPSNYDISEDNTASEGPTLFDISPIAVRKSIETTYRALRPTVTVWSRQSERNSQFGDMINAILGSPSGRWAPIDIPESDIDNLKWLSLLDVSGLKAWSQHIVDIVIVVTSHSGALIRLLEDIADSQYYNFQKPRITIYLPPGPADPSLVNYIERTLHWPNDRIVMQSTSFSGSGSSVNRQLLSAIRSYIPSVKSANVLLLTDTVRLSRKWLEYVNYMNLRLQPQMKDTEMTKELPQLAGISLCPPLKEIQSNSSIYLTQSQAQLSCTMYFPPHFKVLQSFFSEQAAEGLKRTLPLPEELAWVTSNTAGSTVLKNLLSPIYIRGYVFAIQNILQVIAIDTVSADLFGSQDERKHFLIEQPLYEFLIESEIWQDIPMTNKKEESEVWTLLPVFPDRDSKETMGLQQIQDRGVSFAKTISPECNHNIVKSRASLKSDLEDDDLVLQKSSVRLNKADLDLEQENLIVIPRIDDDWSDIFCNDLSRDETVDNVVHKAKTIEDERRERKGLRAAAPRQKPKRETKKLMSISTRSILSISRAVTQTIKTESTTSSSTVRSSRRSTYTAVSASV